MSFAMGTKSGVMLRTLLNRSPEATAKIRGGSIRGETAFYQLPCGVLVRAEISGLPEGAPVCGGRIFGFHIHEGGSCTGTRGICPKFKRVATKMVKISPMLQESR